MEKYINQYGEKYKFIISDAFDWLTEKDITLEGSSLDMFIEKVIQRQKSKEPDLERERQDGYNSALILMKG